MTLNGAQIIVENELKKELKQELNSEIGEINGSNWKIAIMPSQSTNSVYYKIINNHTSMIFRISDHNTSKDMSYLLITQKVTEDMVRRYVRNRVSDFRKRSHKTMNF